MLDLWFLGGTVTAVSVLGITIGRSLFLANAGPERVPLFYLLLAAVSIPVSLGLSPVMERYSRPRVLCGLFAVGSAAVVGVWWLMARQALPGCFAAFAVLSLVELIIGVLFWALVSDYLTALELKRYAPSLTMAMAAGGIAGGGLARVLAASMPTQTMLLALPVFYVLAMLPAVRLELRSGGMMAPEPDPSVAMGGVLRSLSPLLRQYPMILLLVISTFWIGMLQRVAEFQTFTIYSVEFPDERALTAFLGMATGGFRVVEFLVTYFVTRPLIQRVGVGRMNVLYPTTSLVSFILLGLQFRLPSAVAAHMNLEALARSIDDPVFTLNFNAVPRRLRGHVRLLCEAVLYPLGFGVAGLALIVGQHVVSSFIITAAGIVLSAVLVLFGVRLGAAYVASLVGMLQARSVALDEVSEGFTRLPRHYAREVRPLLVSQNPTQQVLGLELASRMDPSLLLEEIDAAVGSDDRNVQNALLRLFAQSRHRSLIEYAGVLLKSMHGERREIGLQVHLACAAPVPEARLRSLLSDPEPHVRAMAGLSAWQTRAFGGGEHVEADKLLPRIGSAGRRAVYWALIVTEDERLRPLVAGVAEHASGEDRAEGLNALRAVARRGDGEVTALAESCLTDETPEVRAAALGLLAVTGASASLPRLAAGLADTERIVRDAAVEAMSGFGTEALPFAEPLLDSLQPEVVESAIRALGAIPEAGAKVLLARLEGECEGLRRSLVWLRSLPAAPEWQLLSVAVKDFHNELIRRLLQVLSALGHKRIIASVRHMLRAPDERIRADAVEVLASLREQRVIQPLMPLLEELAVASTPDASPASVSSSRPAIDVGRILEESLKASNRWIRIAAVTICGRTGRAIDGSVLNDPDPLVREVARRVRREHEKEPRQTEEVSLIDHLQFLQQVPLFRGLPLDDLLAVDGALQRVEYVRGETICEEGTVGTAFHLVHTGWVRIAKGEHEPAEELARLGPGEYFGEMALFDDAPRSATVTAHTPCALLELDRTRFHSLVAQRPEILLEMCKLLSGRLREADERLAARG